METGPVRFLPPDDDTAPVSFAGLVGRDIQADFRDNRVRLGDLVVRDPHVRLVRETTGLNLASLLALDPAPPPAPAPAPAETRQAAPPREPHRPVSVVVGRARLEGGVLEFADRTTNPVVTTALRDVGVELREIGFGSASAPGRLQVDARMEGGQVRLDGTVEGANARLAGPRARDRLAAASTPPVPGARAARGHGGQGALDASARGGAGPRGPRLEVTGGTVGARDLALALPSARTPTFTSRR